MDERPTDDGLWPAEVEKILEESAEVSEPASLEEQVMSLNARLEKANLETTEMQAMLQRVQADFVNYKRRSEQEREEIQRFFNAGLIVRLLPVLDELGMALGQAPTGSPNDAWTEGVRLINRKLQSVLESEGVSPIEANGKVFNPMEHEALGFRESAEQEDGEVVEVVRPGYTLKGKVLRPAQVIVAKAPEHSQ